MNSASPHSQSRSETLTALVAHRIIAVVRYDNNEFQWEYIEAMIEGGIRVLEVTLTTPNALQLINTLAVRSNLIVGVGSVFAKEQLVYAVEAGAKFYASPICQKEIIDCAAANDCISMPGAFTPTEIMAAWHDGADLVKVFPMPAEGPSYIRALRGPMREVVLAPSGGVSDKSARNLLEAGANILNVGSWLTHTDGKTHSASEVLRRSQLLVSACAY